MRLRAAVNLFLDAGRGEVAATTTTWYARQLAGLLDELGPAEAGDVTIGELRAWRAGLLEQDEVYRDHPGRPAVRRKLSPFTVNGRIRACRRLFRWLTAERIIAVNPAQRLGLVKLPDLPPRGIDDQAAGAMLQAAIDDNLRDAVIVALLFDTGCRVGGLAGLRLADVELDARRASVREKGAGGQRRQRFVFFSAETAELLRRYLAERPQSGVPELLVTRAGQALTVSGLQQVIKRLGRRTGVNGPANAHAFRHHYARSLIKKGADISLVSQALGHASITTTASFYARFNTDELADMRDAYGAPLPVDLPELKPEPGLIDASMLPGVTVEKRDGLATLLAFFLLQPGATYDQAAAAIGKSKTTVHGYLAELRAAGLVETTGAGVRVLARVGGEQ